MNQPIFQSKICFVVVKQAICASTIIDTIIDIGSVFESTILLSFFFFLLLSL